MHRCELEVAEGLESIAQRELEAKIGHIDNIQYNRGALQFDYAGSLAALLQLKTVIAVYLVQYYPIPRPKALLGHENFHLLLDLIDTAQRATSPQDYHTLHLNAAGSGSSVMRRIKESLAEQTHLEVNEEGGDLLLRIRRHKPGWDVLVRVGPRPSVTRDWRVCNMEGALNAAVAHAMILLTTPAPDDVFLNVACGSGTLMIERWLYGRSKQIIGCDVASLACAEENMNAAGVHATLLQSDGRVLPLLDQSIGVLCADLPFGQLVGSHEENAQLYPAILREAARVAEENARFVVITHEVRLMERVLEASDHWQSVETIMVTLRGLHPRIYVLERTGN